MKKGRKEKEANLEGASDSILPSSDSDNSDNPLEGTGGDAAGRIDDNSLEELGNDFDGQKGKSTEKEIMGTIPVKNKKHQKMTLMFRKRAVEFLSRGIQKLTKEEVESDHFKNRADSFIILKERKPKEFKEEAEKETQDEEK